MVSRSKLVEVPLILLSILTFLILPVSSTTNTASALSRQVQERVRENVEYFMNAPPLATSLQSDFYSLGGFPNNLQAPDRVLALKYLFSFTTTHQLEVYYGLETGFFLGYLGKAKIAANREPGESGYIPGTNRSDGHLDKYWNTCVNRDTGQPEECRMSLGAKYVQCQNHCELVPCPTQVAKEKKWCRNYTIETVQPHETRGYIPRTYHCINEGGQFTQTPGQILKPDHTLGNCTFSDGTLVTSQIKGEYAYCQGKSSCEDTYTGTYRSMDYDPRYRGWYKATKQSQHHTWSDPYTFFTTGDIGITWADPLYSTDPTTGRSIFQGILAVDYPLDAISKFLVQAYKTTDTMVVIVEDKEPHYVVGVSTGGNTTKKVLQADPTKPCPPAQEDTHQKVECQVVRLPLAQLDQKDHDRVFQNAFVALKEAGFPGDSFIGLSFQEGGQADGYYSAVSIVYEHLNANLKWRILVINPIQQNTNNTITQGQNGLFLPLCLTGALGFTACMVLFAVYFRRRAERAVIFSDYRFTSAFIFGCALLNLTTFTLLGENTDHLCMLRMWSYRLIFSMALSPLFVKVYRLWQLTGHSAALQRHQITNLQAAVYTVPIPALQAIILLLFSIFDPPRQTETMEWEGDSLVPNVLCAHETNAFMITQLVFDASLVCVGCFLAFLSRNMDRQFGEPKQLLFSMYNIAVTVVILTVMFQVVGIEEDVKRILQTIGIFWATVVSSAAFVVPRLLQANREASQRIIVSRASVSLPRNSSTTSRLFPAASEPSFSGSAKSREEPSPLTCVRTSRLFPTASEPSLSGIAKVREEEKNNPPGTPMVVEGVPEAAKLPQPPPKNECVAAVMTIKTNASAKEEEKLDACLQLEEYWKEEMKKRSKQKEPPREAKEASPPPAENEREISAYSDSEDEMPTVLVCVDCEVG